jgi:hypothetical protein
MVSPLADSLILRRYAIMLGLCTALFAGRVAGQLPVAFIGVPFLPPMPAWYSGLVPYPLLLPIQIGILALMLRMVRDFWRGRGWFVEAHPRAGRILRGLSIVYFASMVVRHAVTMWLHPEWRWFTGTIPIWFHMVLALFLFSYSHYHLRSHNKTGGD